MDFGIFEAQPEMLLPKFRPGANSFEDLLVPFGGENIRTVGQRVAQTVEETVSGQDEKRCWLSVMVQPCGFYVAPQNRTSS